MEEPKDEDSGKMMPQIETAPRGEDALALLFEKHSQRVLSAAFRVTGSLQDAEDVLQTVFLRLARRGDGGELDERAGSYLHKAAVNAAIDLLRSRNRSGAVALDEFPQEPVDKADVSPEERQRDRELRRRVRQALLDLPERGARIFALRFFEDLSNKEIASMLGLSQTAVGVNLFRTRRRLRVKLQEFAGGEA